MSARGWRVFDLSYQMDDGSWWSVEFSAQSQEDAETRTRCIRASTHMPRLAMPGQAERLQRRHCKCGHVDSMHGLVSGSHPKSCIKCKCQKFEEVKS